MWKKVAITVSIVISLALIWGALSMSKKESTASLPTDSSVVREENGLQYIRILARGGYSPQQITAKANMPTILEVETKGTYDCSAALTVPQLSYQKFLPATGVTQIQVPKEQANKPLDIVCSMGMYHATVNFNS